MAQTKLERVDEIIDCYGADKALSLAVLQEIQTEYNYLPRELLERVAERLGIAQGEVYRMATFYHSFSTQPKGEFCIRVCMGTACHVNGGPLVLEAFERELGIKAGESTPDGAYSLEATACLGACAQAPYVTINEEPHAKMSTDRVADAVATCQCALPEAE